MANVTNERTPRRLLSDVKVRWFHTKYNARGVSAPSAGVSRNDVDTWYLIFGRQLTCKMYSASLKDNGTSTVMYQHQIESPLSIPSTM